MTVCPEYENMMWMDIHDELSPGDRRVWKAHLSVCRGCRDEKRRSARIIGRVRQTLAPPPLPDAAVNRAVARIVEKSLEHSSTPVRPKRRLFTPIRFIPVAAAACALIISIGVYNLKTTPRDPVSSPVATLGEELRTDDLEVIRNLELLTEFEAIEKLVQVTAHPGNPDAPSHGPDEGIQGNIHGEGRPIYG